MPFRGNAGGDAVGSLLAMPEPPTALVVANTTQVHNAMRRLLQMGVRIPDELSVIFDHNPSTELVTPPLSVVHQPIVMLALHSVEVALGRNGGRLLDGARSTKVQAKFIPCGSCAPPRQTKR